MNASSSTSSIIVLDDYPHRHLGRRFRGAIGSAAGAVLLILGLTASIPALPANLAVLSFVAGWMTTEPTDPDPWPAPDVPVAEIVLAWAVSTPLAFGGIKGGLRLLRRGRTLILFLRRFGYDDAQSAVTFAVLETIGARWRVVTLDDAEMAPIGVPAATRGLFRAGHVISKYVLAFGHFAGLRMFQICILASWAILAAALVPSAIEFAATGVTRWEDWIAVVTPFLDILFSIFDGNPPLDAIAPTLQGLFAIAAMGAAIGFAALGVTMAALLLAFPLSTVLFFFSSAADAVREAERSKTAVVNTIAEIRQATSQVAQRSRKVFGPRLVVLRVASPFWRQAVTELAGIASLPLIDVSEPTANVMWELDGLIARFGDRCVLIGQRDRVAELASLAAAGGEPASVEGQVAALLRGRQVLTYTTDRRGLTRFARALRGLLLSRHPD